MSHVEVISPTTGYQPTSPLAVVKVRFSAADSDQAELRVNDARHYIHLDDNAGEFQENVTLLEGRNIICALVGEARHQGHPPARAAPLLENVTHILGVTPIFWP